MGLSMKGSGEPKRLGERTNEVEKVGPSEEALPRRAILCYGTGHMLNDLTAACWFTYLLIFLTDVGLSPREAATVMLAGQVADGMATIIVGQLIDRFGRFKIWHGGGSLLVAVSFSSVFGGCMACALLGSNYAVAHTIGYSAFAAIFNIGWAATQVSHMSLVNCITANSSSQVALNSCRNAFTMVANLGLYVIAFLVFRIIPAKQACDVELQFKWIAGAAIATGSCFVLVFLFGVKEPKLSHHRPGCEESPSKGSYKDWFKKLLYYQVAAVYMLTRLTTNVSQALLPFYLIDDLHMEESSKAVVPALIYACSFLASIVLQLKKAGRRVVTIGRALVVLKILSLLCTSKVQELRWTSLQVKVVFSMGAGLWVLSGAIFLLLPQTLHAPIYFLSVFIGIGNAFMLVTATSMEGLLVSKNLSGCGFVYGSLSFMDKLACGIALYLIEGMNVQTRICPAGNDRLLTFPAICHCSLIRVALALVPSGCALLAWIITTTMTFEDSTTKMTLESPTSIDDLPSLQAPLLIPGPSDEDSQEGPRLRTGKVSSPCTICPSKNYIGSPSDLEAPVDGGNCSEIQDEDEVAFSLQDEGLSFWRRLGNAMVGRWGSIRTAQPWLR